MEGIRRDPRPSSRTSTRTSAAMASASWIAWTNRIGRDADGQIADILSVGTDITEQHRAEDALRASEQRYRDDARQHPGRMSADRVRLAVSLSQRCRRQSRTSGANAELLGRTMTEALAGHCR